ncbi:MAG: HD domain-containing protein [Actinobacteria bacterium]|nr:HD domain-containing protein [Actinomycetota bacterium]
MAITTPVSNVGGGDLAVDELLEQAREVEATDIGRARSLVQQSRVISRSRGDQASEAEALYRLAELSYASGLNNEALAVALEARDLAHQCGASISEVSALNLIAAVQYHAGNFSEALGSACAALDLYRATGERASEGLLLNSLAVIQHSLRDTDRAIVTYEAALMANKGQARPDLDAVTLANMAKVRADRHEDLLAVSLGESALDLAKQHAPEFVPEILARLAIAYVALAALDRATSCLDDADGVLRDRTERRLALSPGCVVTVRIARGELYVAQSLREEALREWGEALELAAEAKMTEVSLKLRDKLANLCKEMGDYKTALMHQEARYELNEQMFDRGSDLRITTLQVQHDTEVTRQQAEILRLRTANFEPMLQARIEEVEAAQVEALIRVAAATEGKNVDAIAHPIRVGELAAEIAACLEQDEEFVRRLQVASRLHDIGKVAIPDAILTKPGPLTAVEFEAVKAHAIHGNDILSGSSSPLISLAAEIASSHHERWDGSGYPNGLVGDEIPFCARIVAVADVYDALLSTRVYKQPWPHIDAINYIAAGSGTRFEPRVVEAFLDVIVVRDPSLADHIERPSCTYT